MADPLVARLRAVVGDRNVLDERDLVSSYESDWTGRFRGRARCVVRPADTAEVVAVLRACGAEGVTVVPQGGNTGLVAGAVPSDNVVLSLTRLDAIGAVDPLTRQVTAGAGVTLRALQEHVRGAGLTVGVDLAARDSATVGGMLATNAGGERVLRYGSMRAQVVGAEAVLADGTVVSRLSGLVKDNTGYDLVSLLVGSEGTLGVVTQVRLRLVPLPAFRTALLVAVTGTAEALRVLGHLGNLLPDLESAELFYRDGLHLVCEHVGVPPPFDADHPAYVLLECAGRDDRTEEVLEALASCPDVLDAAVAADSRDRARLWRYREAHTEAINAAGVPVKLDVAVPLAVLADAVHAISEGVASGWPGTRTILFGHLQEGNLHVNVLGAGEHAEEITEQVLRTVARFGGSISAEHGVGRAKRDWLPLSRDRDEIEAMRRIKRALDPHGLLNPGVLFGE